jgi:hypothetical protein
MDPEWFLVTEEEGLMAGAEARGQRLNMWHYYSSTSQRFVRNEHPVAILLGGVRVRHVGHLTSVPIKPPPPCAICAHKSIVSLINAAIYYCKRLHDLPQSARAVWERGIYTCTTKFG